MEDLDSDIDDRKSIRRQNIDNHKRKDYKNRDDDYERKKLFKKAFKQKKQQMRDEETLEDLDDYQ